MARPVSVTVTPGPEGMHVIVCSSCGRVARREMLIDAETKAERHAEAHQRQGDRATVTG